MATAPKPAVSVTASTGFVDQSGRLTQYGMNTLLNLLARVETLEATPK